MGYFDSIYSDDDLPHRAKAVYMYLQDRMDSQRQGHIEPVYRKISDSGKGRTSPPRGRRALLLDRGEVHGGPPGREHFRFR